MRHELSARTGRRTTSLLVLSLTVLLTGTIHGQSVVSFQNCAQAALSGMHDIPRSAPEYAIHLDRDKDGIACESSGKDDGSSLALRVTLPTSAEQLVRTVTAPQYQGVVAMNVLSRGGPQWRLSALSDRLMGPVKTLTRTVFQVRSTGAPLTRFMTETASFDRKGRLVRYDSAPVDKKDSVYDRHLQATFNASGQVVREDVNDSTGMESVIYKYDARGNLTSLTDLYDGEPAHLVRLERRPAGVIERTYNLPENEANGLTWTVLNQDLRVTQTEWTSSSHTYQSFLEYDPEGRMVRATQLETEGSQDTVVGLKKVVTTYQRGLPIGEDTYSAGTLFQVSYPSTWQYEGVDQYGNYRKATEFIEVRKGGVVTLSRFREFDQTVAY